MGNGSASLLFHIAVPCFAVHKACTRFFAQHVLVNGLPQRNRLPFRAISPNVGSYAQSGCQSDGRMSNATECWEA
jgi:hypothetical protein